MSFPAAEPARLSLGLPRLLLSAPAHPWSIDGSPQRTYFQADPSGRAQVGRAHPFTRHDTSVLWVAFSCRLQFRIPLLGTFGES